MAPHASPHGLTFTWLRCYCLCQRHESTELAHSFLYSVLASVSLFMVLSTVFHSINSPNNSAFSLCSSGLISVLLVLSTLYLPIKVSLSPDVILCGWLGLKHQLTNSPCKIWNTCLEEEKCFSTWTIQTYLNPLSCQYRLHHLRIWSWSNTCTRFSADHGTRTCWKFNFQFYLLQLVSPFIVV